MVTENLYEGVAPHSQTIIENEHHTHDAQHHERRPDYSPAGLASPSGGVNSAPSSEGVAGITDQEGTHPVPPSEGVVPTRSLEPMTATHGLTVPHSRGGTGGVSVTEYEGDTPTIAPPSASIKDPLIGMHVTVVGLRRDTHLNGKKAVVTRVLQAGLCAVLTLPDRQEIRLHVRHLLLPGGPDLSPPSGTVGGTDGTSTDPGLLPTVADRTPGHVCDAEGHREHQVADPPDSQPASTAEATRSGHGLFDGVKSWLRRAGRNARLVVMLSFAPLGTVSQYGSTLVSGDPGLHGCYYGPSNPAGSLPGAFFDPPSGTFLASPAPMAPSASSPPGWPDRPRRQLFNREMHGHHEVDQWWGAYHRLAEAALVWTQPGHEEDDDAPSLFARTLPHSGAVALTAAQLHRHNRVYNQAHQALQRMQHAQQEEERRQAAYCDPTINPFCSNPDDRQCPGGGSSTATPHAVCATVGYEASDMHAMPTVIPCHCTTARLLVGLQTTVPASAGEAQHSRNLTCVVDTGAAWTAISKAKYTDLRSAAVAAGHTVPNLQRDGQRFHAVSGGQLNCLGHVAITVRLGNQDLPTRAYVFDKMAVDMLLGTNTFRDFKMVVDYADSTLYSKALPDSLLEIRTDASPRSQLTSATVTCDDAPQPVFGLNRDRSMFYIAVEGRVIAKHAAKPVRRPSRRTAHDNGITGLTDDEGPSDSELPLDDASSHLTALAAAAHTDEDRHICLTDNFAPPVARRDRTYRTIMPTSYVSAAELVQDVVVPPFDPCEVPVLITSPHRGPNISISVELSPEARTIYPELTDDPLTPEGRAKSPYQGIFESRNRIVFYKLVNQSDRPLHLRHGAPLFTITAFRDPDMETFSMEVSDDVDGPDPDSIGTTAALLVNAVQSTYLEDQLSKTQEDDHRLATDAEIAAASPAAVTFEGLPPASELQHPAASAPSARPYDAGGADDLRARGLDLDQSYNLVTPEPRLLDASEKRLIADAFLDNFDVLSSNAKSPRPCRLKFAWVTIATQDHQPIRQKPYPIAAALAPHVIDEVEGLVKAGLITPGYSDWCSPVIVITKKDHNPAAGKVAIKLAIDYRKLNSCTVVDSGGLGTMTDILYSGKDYESITLADAAGGYYQFRLTPEASRRSCFILPTSCGGTSFLWRVAPYGLANMPALYSRVMMYVTSGMKALPLGDVRDCYPEFDCSVLPPAMRPVEPTTTSEPARSMHRGAAHALADARRTSLGRGDIRSWLDDLRICSGFSGSGLAIHGHAQMLRLVFERLVAAGITLKGSKTHVLRLCTEVLGHIVTREGLKPNPEKVEAIRNMPSRLNTPKDILQFMGMVNFYRQYIHQISTKAEPLFRLLKKDNLPPPGQRLPWGEEQQQAYDGIKAELADDCLNSHPDLLDPNAEFCMLTDASKVAAGAALFQWQRVKHGDRGENTAEQFIPDLLHEYKDPFLQAHKKRVAAGYQLKCLGFFSKTFNDTQRNWAIYDKEAASIVLGVAQWRTLIEARPCTIYTDNTVAESILRPGNANKPPRLQRWGIELGRYLPLLRIAYRKGESMVVPDHLSRYPAPGSNNVEVPDDLYEKIASGVRCGSKKFDLFESSMPQAIEQIWQNADAGDGMQAETYLLDSPESCDAEYHLYQMLMTTLQDDSPPEGVASSGPSALSTDEDFQREREDAQATQAYWQQFIETFRRTRGRDPVLYDLYTGGGGYALGAAAAGCQVHGFDISPEPLAYGLVPNEEGRRDHQGRAELDRLTNMTYHQLDLDDDALWTSFTQQGHLLNLPRPDIIHASPPCSPHSKLRHKRGHLPADEWDVGHVRRLTDRLVQYSARQADSTIQGLQRRFVPFSIENVTAIGQTIRERVPHSSAVTLCGTQFGLKVFRHRVFVSNVVLHADLDCHHEGKLVGTNGLVKPLAGAPVPNMYGLYSRQSRRRGTLDELSRAMGHTDGMFSYADLVQSVPSEYGRLVSAQLVAGSLLQNFDMPVLSQRMAEPGYRDRLRRWAVSGYKHVAGLDSDWSSPTAAAPRPHLGQNADSSSHAAYATDVEAIGATTTRDGPWSLRPEHQRHDPETRLIIDSLLMREDEVSKQTTARALQVARHRRDFELNDHDFLTQFVDGGRPKIVVPMRFRRRLLFAYHVLPEHAHLGAETLYRRLKVHYHWEGMKTDCERFVGTCEVCSVRQAQGFADLGSQPRPEPPHPFHTIHIDHKNLAHRPSGSFEHILVVVCALTRYAIFIPVESTSAEDTFDALINRVFCLFGLPHNLVCDNAFRSQLMTLMSEYLGFRSMPVVPYTPQSNSFAELGVKKISGALNKHTLRHAQWHKSLPVLAAALNSVVHSSTGMSPFFAVFGRAPTGLTELEMPAVEAVTATGNEYLDAAATRMSCAWEDIRHLSQAAKSSYIAKQGKDAIAKISDIRKDDYVLLRHGGKEHSKNLRKRGAPSLRHFRVVDTFPGKAYVRLDTGSTGILPIQSLRHCLLAPREFAVFDDGTPSSGVVGQPAATRVDTVVVDREVVIGDEMADYAGAADLNARFQGIVEARRVGDAWQYLCVWSDADEPSWLDEAELAEGNADIAAWMEEARAELTYREEAEREQDRSGAGGDATDVEVAEGLPAGSGVPLPIDQSVAEVQDAIAARGPFKHELFVSTTAGRQVKRYRMLRSRKGGQLGGHDHLVWLEFNDMTDDEQLRTRRYMYDNDVEQFVASPLYAYYGVDMLGFATPLSSLVDSSEKG